MSITIEVDEGILREAEDASHIHDHADLIQRALKTFALRQKAQRHLASLGGTMPDLELPPRQRQDTTLP